MTIWRSQPLSDEHDLRSFDCGVLSLNEGLFSQAMRAQRSDTARTYVWTPPGTLNAVAYYSIAPTQIQREEVTRSLSGGVTVIPGYLLARFALDRSLRGKGLGGELLFDAIEIIVHAAEQTAGRLIVVDAIDEDAAAFYTRHGFQPVKGNADRLVMKLATARKALGR